MVRYYNLILVAVFSLESLALVPLKNGNVTDNLSLVNKAGGVLNLADVHNIPEYLVKMYEVNQKINNGIVRGNSERNPPVVHCFIGQASTKLNIVLFNLSASDIGTEGKIVSAQIRALIKTTVPDSPLPQRGRLVLYDGLSRTAVYSKAFQGGGIRWYVFPARALVKRWIFSPHLNHGVYFKVKSHVPRVKQSLLVDVNVKAPRNKRPLLIVETDNTKVQGIEDITSLMSETKKMTSRISRRPRAIVRDDGPCSKRPMKVHVRKHLNMNDVLIPRTFESFRCGGECTFPLDKSVHPTGHAVIRTILYSSGLDQGAGEPCCVPVKLRGLSVFVEKSPGAITIRSFQGMVVEECGCR